MDLDDPAQVTHAITRLSDVWGGMYMPILDANADPESLRAAARLFDVDSVYAEIASDEFREFLRSSHYGWKGRGEYGPFSEGKGFRTGLLPASALVGAAETDAGPWQGPREPSLALSSYLGARTPPDDRPESRPILETTRLLKLSISYVRPEPRGFVVLREDNARDAAWFWNCRVLSGSTFPLLAGTDDFNAAVLADVGDPSAFIPATPPGPPNDAQLRVPVWGFEDLAPSERLRLASWAEQNQVQLDLRDRDDALDRTWFPGFERISSRSFRVEARSTARQISVDIPRLPLLNSSESFQGVVAAEFDFHEATGVDPRLTVAIPPHQRYAALLGRAGYGTEQTRVSTVGPVFGVQADVEETSVLNVPQVDVMRLLFDDEEVRVDQSNEGKFQTRAAEMFGGPLAGHLAQPGVRAAIQEASTRSSGMTFAHLRQVVMKQRGEWPDPIRSHQMPPQRYAEQQVHLLLNSGLLVPWLQTQCHECRITLRLSPEQLGTMVECEFCGAEIRLALALALTRPEWRYRLAGHLAASQVEAFLPAMAASAVLGSLNHLEGPPASHMFGLEVRLPNRRPIEVDVAMIMHEDRWTVILGEVKNHNPIDVNDVGNLFALCRALSDKGVPAIPLYATFNDEFSRDEQQAIRTAMDADRRGVTIHGQSWPLTPLLLTRPDMSLPYFHDDHPWRWSKPGSGAGSFGIALESVKRHLGLEDVTWSADGRPRFVWPTDVPTEVTEAGTVSSASYAPSRRGAGSEH